MEASSAAVPDLRPLGIGEILDAAFKVYRSRFKTLALCVLVPIVPLTILQVLFTASISDDAFDPTAKSKTTTAETATYVGFGVTILLLSLLSFAALAACTRAASAAYLGEDSTWQDSLRFGLRKLVPVLLLLLTVFAGFILIGLLLGGLLAVSPVLGGLVLLAAIVPLNYASLRLIVVAVPALLVEDVGPVAAIKRSWRLVGGRWWASYFVVLIAGVILTLLSVILQALLLAPIVAGTDSEVVGGLLSGLGSIVSNAITLPLLAAVVTVLYFDLRVRKEGLDLQLLTERMGGGTSRSDLARSSGLGGGEEASGYGGFAPPSAGGFAAPSAGRDPVRPPEEHGTS